jgi:ribonuclease PH
MTDILERRPRGREAHQLRPVNIGVGLQRNPLGSVLIATGDTRVICAATAEQRVPPWLKGQSRGWVTAEYAMLPGSTDTRSNRRPNSRATEIRRLIGRSLRAVTDLGVLDGWTITVDCDVLDADGGTRTASVTGAWVALYQACRALAEAGKVSRMAVTGQVAAVSVGICQGVPLLDLDYPEDRDAQVDMNVVATAFGRLVELQGTAEGAPFERTQLDRLIDLSLGGIKELARAQREALGLSLEGPEGDDP